MEKRITLLPGDGIGPEIMEQAVRVIDKLNIKNHLNIETVTALVGGAGLDQKGKALPEETLAICQKSDAILLAAIGGPKWEKLPHDEQPERGGLLKLRKTFDLYANLRPVTIFKELKNISPLKNKLIETGVDLLFIRELSGGIYFGNPRAREGSGDQTKAYDTMVYHQWEIERVARFAFQQAMQRNKKVTSIDKANVLTSSMLWRETVNHVSADFPEVKLNHLYVDAASMKLITHPQNFDVILVENLFGDILSDEASVLSGSIGLLPSASLNQNNFGLYEPIHGSAPDIAGQGIANPVGQILSVAMLFKYTYKMDMISSQIYQAVQNTIREGYRTIDIMEEGCIKATTGEFGDEVIKRL